MGTDAAKDSATRPTALHLENTLTCGLLACDTDGVILQVNDAACRYLGRDRDALVGRSVTRQSLISATYVSLDGKRIRRADLPLQTTLRTGEPVAAQVIGIRRPGGDEWVVESADAVHDPETGALLMVVATFSDITPAWQSEHARLAALAELETVLLALPDLYFHVDASGTVTNYHSGGVGLYQTPEMLVSRPLVELLPPDVAGRLSGALSKAHASRDAVTMTYELPIDGAARSFEARIQPLADGEETVIIVRDTTEQATALAELRAQRDFSEAIMRSSAVLIAVGRPASGMVAVSDMLLATSGYGRKELLGEDFVERLVSTAWMPRVKSLVGDAIKRRSPAAFECPLLTRDGRELLVEWNVVPMTDGEGEEYFVASGVEVTERRATELAVQVSEARYRGLFEDAPIALFEEDESGAKALVDDLMAAGVGDVREYCQAHPEFVQTCVDAMTVIDVNKAAVAMYGAASKDELVHEWATDWAPENYEGMVEVVVAIAEGRTHVRLEEEDTTADGRTIHIVETWAVLPGSEQTYDRVLLADIDVTEQVTAVRALGESEQRYRSFVENFHGIAFRSAVDFTPAFMHGAVEAITGYTEAELLSGRPRWDEIILPEDRPAKLADAERVNREPGYRHEQDYRIARKDGAVRWVHEVLESVANGDGQVAYVQGALYDITASKAAEEALLASQEALLESEELHRALFERSPVGISVFDTDGVIIECNDRIAEMMHTSRENMIGFSHRDDAQDKRPLPAIEAALRGKSSEYEGAYLATTSGAEAWISVRTSPLCDAKGAIRGGMAVVTDLADRHRYEERIRHLALHDSLTDLPNRELFKDRLLQAISQADRSRHTVAVAVVNIDRFRNFNDTLGREAGNRLLRQVAARLLDVVRDGDTVARPGGDEFLLLLPGVKHVGAAVRVSDKIMEAFRRSWDFDGQEFYLTPSIGIALYPGDGDDPESLLSSAEAALRDAKKVGRNTCRFFDTTMNAEVSERVRLENDLHSAVERDEFELHYQPQVETGSGRVVGVEALLRWRHPERGLMAPLDFIPVAEETGLIVPIGEWVLRTACRQVKEWAAKGHEGLLLAVNLSARQFQQLDLAPTVAAVLAETGLEPGRLELEITETLAMQNVDFTARVLADLRAMGAGIALDDFGTGFSSLSHLSGLPITTLKIDRTFVGNLDRDRSLAAIAAAVITLGHQLGLGVVAEGAERPEEVAWLRERGCDLVQGFYFSRPLPAAELAVVLEKGALPV